VLVCPDPTGHFGSQPRIIAEHQVVKHGDNDMWPLHLHYDEERSREVAMNDEGGGSFSMAKWPFACHLEGED
jgi:hypothetical protein